MIATFSRMIFFFCALPDEIFHPLFLLLDVCNFPFSPPPLTHAIDRIWYWPATLTFNNNTNRALLSFGFQPNPVRAAISIHFPKTDFSSFSSRETPRQKGDSESFIKGFMGWPLFSSGKTRLLACVTVCIRLIWFYNLAKIFDIIRRSRAHTYTGSYVTNMNLRHTGLQLAITV